MGRRRHTPSDVHLSKSGDSTFLALAGQTTRHATTPPQFLPSDGHPGQGSPRDAFAVPHVEEALRSVRRLLHTSYYGAAS